MTFEPTETEIEVWGKLQIVINDMDRTTYRGVETIIEGYVDREPFGDASCTIRFPGITPFEAETSYPFQEFQNLDINRVTLDGVFIENLFEGMIVSYDDSFGEGLTVQAIGALYQADFFIQPPIFNDYPYDMASGISRALNTRSEFYGLRLQPMNPRTYTNIVSKSRGSWNPLLTGWIQDLLANAWSDGFLIKGEEACAMVRTSGSYPDGIWMLGHFGSNLSLGAGTPYYGASSYLTRYVAALYGDTELYMRDITARPQHDGLWVIDRHGKVFPYGAAEHYGDINDLGVHAWAIASTSTGEGYWIMDSEGQVYEFGDAVNYGSVAILVPHLGFADAAIDFDPMPDDSGYRILTRVGRVIAFGSAVDYGETLMTDKFFTAIQTTPTGLGYYTLDTSGAVFAFGDAVHYGEASSPNSWAVDLSVSESGEGYAILIDTGRIEFFGDYRDVGTAEWSMFQSHGANMYQWTLTKETGRVPVMKVKNTWDTNWTVTCGQPGVTHQIARDFKWAPNVYYGEGIDENNCRWRNSRYPNVHPDSAPVWPGYNITVHEYNDSLGAAFWEQKMFDSGWPVVVDANYDLNDQQVCMRFQEANGITVDGVIGPQTWAATFLSGENANDLNAAYLAPIVTTGWVEPFLYDASGAIAGQNPYWDNSYIRLETYNNYGEHVEKVDAIISAQARLRSQSGPNFVGTIKLQTDPEEGHRFDIRAGQNIRYMGFKTYDVLFHIVEVNRDINDLSVTLTVDTASRDAMTVAQVIARNQEANNVSLTPTRWQSQSMVVEDRIAVWDCVAKGSLVETPNGPVAIEDVNTGDLVYAMSHEGIEVARVGHTGSKGTQQSFKIKTGRRTLRASAGHLVCCVDNGVRVWKPVEEIGVGDEVLALNGVDDEQRLLAAADIMEIGDPTVAWLHGVFTGDGHLQPRTIAFCVFGDLREKVILAMDRAYGLKPFQINDKRGVQFYSREVHELWMSLGLGYHRSTSKRVPSYVFRSTTQEQLAFLSGYIDADAHERAPGHYNFALANPVLAEELRHLAITLGMSVCNIHKEDRKRPIIIKGLEVKNANPLYRFTINQNAIKRGRRDFQWA